MSVQNNTSSYYESKIINIAAAFFTRYEQPLIFLFVFTIYIGYTPEIMNVSVVA